LVCSFILFTGFRFNKSNKSLITEKPAKRKSSPGLPEELYNEYTVILKLTLTYLCSAYAEQELAPYNEVGCQGITGPVPPPFWISDCKERTTKV